MLQIMYGFLLFEFLAPITHMIWMINFFIAYPKAYEKWISATLYHIEIQLQIQSFKTDY